MRRRILRLAALFVVAACIVLVPAATGHVTGTYFSTGTSTGVWNPSEGKAPRYWSQIYHFDSGCLPGDQYYQYQVSDANGNWLGSPVSSPLGYCSGGEDTWDNGSQTTSYGKIRCRIVDVDSSQAENITCNYAGHGHA